MPVFEPLIELIEVEVHRSVRSVGCGPDNRMVISSAKVTSSTFSRGLGIELLYKLKSVGERTPPFASPNSTYVKQSYR